MDHELSQKQYDLLLRFGATVYFENNKTTLGLSLTKLAFNGLITPQKALCAGGGAWYDCRSFEATRDVGRLGRKG